MKDLTKMLLGLFALIAITVIVTKSLLPLLALLILMGVSYNEK